MRWLILILLISCGKHESPKALDLYDSDGDQILNANESELDKYIANTSPIGAVELKMKFHHETLMEYTFSNKAFDALKLMIRSENNIISHDYLSETIQIKVTSVKKLETFKLSKYPVLLEFNDLGNDPKELLLVNLNKTTFLGQWNPSMKVEISAEDLKALIAGKAHFSLVHKRRPNKAFNAGPESMIRDKTYRVFIHDGKKSQILHVSKELDLHSLLEHLNVSNAHEIVEDQFFFDPKDISSESWFYRNFQNGDKAVVRSTTQDLKKLFINGYKFNKQEVTRSNGFSKSLLNIKKAPSSNLYLRIRAQRTFRTFIETTETRRYTFGGGGGRDGGGTDKFSCQHQLKNIKTEIAVEVSIEDIMKNLTIATDHKEELQNLFQIKAAMDEKGFFWEIKVLVPTEQLTLGFNDLPTSTYTNVGQYATNCPQGYSGIQKNYAIPTNSEGKFSLEIESYIENID